MLPPPLNGGISNARARSLLLLEFDDDDDDDAADDEADDDDDDDVDFDCDGGSGAFGSTNVVDAGKCSKLGL